MKRRVIIFCLFINLFYTYSKNIQSLFEVDTILTIPNQYLTDLNYRINSISVSDGTVYIYLPTVNDSLIFFCYDLIKRHSYYLIFDLSWLEPPFEISSPTCNSFYVDSDYIFLHYFEGFLLFKRNKHNKLEVVSARELVNPSDLNSYRYSYERSYFDRKNFKIYFWRNYNLQNRFLHKTEIAIYDLTERKFINIINPYFNCIEYSHFYPLEMIDISNKYVIFSQTVKYEIEIYDKNLKKLFVANRNPKTWLQTDTFKLEQLRKEFDTLHASVIIRELDDFNKPGSRVRVIRFINDTLFAVFYSPSDTIEKKQNICYFDVWSISNNGISEVLRDIKIVPPRLNEKCTYHNFPFYPIYNPPVFYNNHVINITLGSEAKLIFQPNKTFRQIQEECDEYIIKNDLHYNLQLFMFHFQ